MGKARKQFAWASQLPGAEGWLIPREELPRAWPMVPFNQEKKKKKTNTVFNFFILSRHFHVHYPI